MELTDKQKLEQCPGNHKTLKEIFNCPCSDVILEDDEDEVDEEFNEQAMGAMIDLGLPEDEAEGLLEDYNLMFN